MPPRPKPPQGRRPAEDRFELPIDGMAQGGQALGFHRGQLVLLPYAIPGERVEAQVVRQERNHIQARGLRLLEASADRVMPRCPHFGPGRCWACQWQHIHYESQVLLKFDLLADALSRQARFSDAVLERALRPLIPSPRHWGYSQVATLYPHPQGGWGFRRMEGGALEVIDSCPLMHDLWNDAFVELSIDFPPLRALTLMVDSDEQVSLTLHLTGEELPELSTEAALSVNALTSDHEPLNLVGDSATHWQMGPRRLRVTAGCFLRANPTQAEALVQAVLQAAQLRGSERVLELYCGAGAFTQALAERCAALVAVDSYPPAINDAYHNLGQQPHVALHEMACADFLARSLDEGDSYDLLLADLPPTGFDDATFQSLLRLEVPRLILVSGQPISLARDLARLAQAGYKLRLVQGIDPAPQTAYVDALALMTRD